MSPNSFTKEFGQALLRGAKQKKLQSGYHAFRVHLQKEDPQISTKDVMKKWLGLPEHQKMKWVPEEVRD